MIRTNPRHGLQPEELQEALQVLWFVSLARCLVQNLVV